jgi:Fe2+ transport system protein B
MENETVPVVEQPVIPQESPVVTPQAPSEGAPAPVEPTMYDLPDGTKVDADGLSKAWKENFMPDYTRKAQELAAIKQKVTEVKPQEEVKPSLLENPDWQPESYAQLATELQRKMWAELQSAAQAEDNAAAERDAYIQREIEEVKALDKNVDMNRVMAHAAKYAFSSLIPAYQNMKAIEDAASLAEERVLKNMQARSAAPVGAPTAGASSASFPPDVRSGLDKARYILRNQT